MDRWPSPETFLREIKESCVVFFRPSAMSAEVYNLHMLFFPFMAQGHMLPLVDMAKLFAARGASVTVLTTPANAAIIRPTLPDAAINPVHLHIIPFPSAAAGLPVGCENRSALPSDDYRPKFFNAVALLRQPFDHVLAELQPDCVVCDMFMPWTFDVASTRGIPHLMFHGTSYFARSASHIFERVLAESLSPSASEFFVLPGLPHRIEMFWTQTLDLRKLAGTPMAELAETLIQGMEVDHKCFGVVTNSFYELEPEYADYYRKTLGIRSWNTGPVALSNQDLAVRSARGGEQQSGADAGDCLNWLDRKPPGSVVYMCFGSASLFSADQLREMALGLESSGHFFVWVVRNTGNDWLPEEYEERIAGKGLIIRGWAPQLLILNHPATGGFVSHCGWNSSLEAISAGLPMVTWPLYAEQFYNEKLLVEVLKIGVPVGSRVFAFKAEERPAVAAAAVEAAVRRLMGGGEEAEGRRKRARELGEKARRAVEKGGSSFEDMGKLMQELMEQGKNIVQKSF
ncbi:UDP-glycosyltransferase 73B5 [Apostasia shenzhenica]|uniref:Glycosyltransferase n=1 Tax=Apostasia shenzhenica TaxID=1088818 RepID=A0A2I0BC16_9ASPA|nr:UDP-glycosyltransferase 73B5 [Apostasia shenzhenica]